MIAHLLTEQVERGSFLPESWRDNQGFNESKFIDWLCSSHEPTEADWNEEQHLREQAERAE